MTKGSAYHYYAQLDREPIVCEVAGQYVWETGEPLAKHRSQYQGTFVRLIELTEEVRAQLDAAREAEVEGD